MEGCKINDLKTIEKEKLSLKDIDVKLFETFAEQIFYTGFVHADPHPGNSGLTYKHERFNTTINISLFYLQFLCAKIVKAAERI